MADRVGKVWGLGSDTTKDPGPWEGEQRNMWKPTQQEALWFHGGNLHQSRHYSLYLALQLKARSGGHPDAGLRPAGGPPPELTLRSPACAEVGAGASVPRTRGRRGGVQLLRRSHLSQAPKRFIFYPHLTPSIPSTTAAPGADPPSASAGVQTPNGAGTVTDPSRIRRKRRSACRTAKTTNVGLP